MDFYSRTFKRIRKAKPDVKDETIKTYLLSIKKISKEMFNSESPKVKYIKNFDNIQKYVKEMPSLASQKSMITAFLVIAKVYQRHLGKHVVELYSEFHKELSKKQEESYIDNDKTEREEKNWITMEEILETIDKLKEEIEGWNPNHSKRRLADKVQQHLVLCLYTMLPPLRNDYSLVKIVKDLDFEKNEENIDKNFNYINISTSTILLCRYKTDKVYGIKKIEIPKKLLDIVCNWENIKKDTFGDSITNDFMLLNTTTLTPMKSNSLTRYLNKIFYPKNISTTLLRKIYLSEKYPVVNTYRDQLKDADIMCHSVSMQKMVYSKK